MKREANTDIAYNVKTIFYVNFAKGMVYNYLI